MTRHSSPADIRPFQPKAKLQNQEDLASRYGRVAVQDVVEALQHRKPAEAARLFQRG